MYKYVLSHLRRNALLLAVTVTLAFIAGCSGMLTVNVNKKVDGISTILTMVVLMGMMFIFSFIGSAITSGGLKHNFSGEWLNDRGQPVEKRDDHFVCLAGLFLYNWFTMLFIAGLIEDPARYTGIWSLPPVLGFISFLLTAFFLWLNWEKPLPTTPADAG